MYHRQKKYNLLFLSFVIITNNSFAQEKFPEFIRLVQINSQNSYDQIQSAHFTGHSKTHLYLSYRPLNFKLIPYINGIYFEGYWLKPDSLRIVIKA